MSQPRDHSQTSGSQPSSLTNLSANNNSTNSNSNQAFGYNSSNNCNRLAFYDYSDQELMSSDNKYKQYVAAIDKALKSFEYTSEWADLVNALGKLNRVLSNNSRFGKIPRRFIIGQRLAQCMHPLLPSGVHLKALETYRMIFDCLGEEQLLADLTIYSNGLFPLLCYAAINVRPAVLDLYERHILPLGERLKLALDGFLISLLHCYEENSESFQRADGLLLKVASGVGVAYFYGSLWRCILQNSSIRLHAITFVLMHFNKKRQLSEQAQVLGLCMVTLVRAICSSLLDKSVLVQRAILDLLMTIFPIHNNLRNEMVQAMASPQNSQHTIGSSAEVVQSSPSKQSLPPPGQQQQVISRKYFKRSELVAIITAALTVLLRRDPSLNRRLCAWFFGSDSSSGGSGGQMAVSITGSTFSSSKSSNLTNFNNTNRNNQANNSNSFGSSSSENTKITCNSGEAKARKKKLIYFDKYARDLVIEAFKRCITNPLTAITSILPPTALTNSFITFTLPYVHGAYGAPAASASSSPSTSTSSLIHLHHSNSFRANALHGNSARSSYFPLTNGTIMSTESYSSMSTFWPYRLLNCIMDQRDISGPILETLWTDILRGLYHEFELITAIVPPPMVLEEIDLTQTDHTKSKSDGRGNRFSDNFNYFMADSNDSSTTMSSSSLNLSSKKVEKKSKRLNSSVKSKNKAKLKRNSAKPKAERKRKKSNTNGVRSQPNLASSANVIEQSACAVHRDEKEPPDSTKSVEESEACVSDEEIASDEDEQTSSLDVSDSQPKVEDKTLADEEAWDYVETAAQFKKHSSKASKKFFKYSHETEPSFGNLGKRNLFFRVKNKFRLQFPLTSSSNSKISEQPSSTDRMASGSNKMRTVVKSFITRNLKVNKTEANQTGKHRKKKKDTDGNMSTASEHCFQPTRSQEEDVSHCDASGTSNFGFDREFTDQLDDEVFELPHQHYYWNPYYQQLNHVQRQLLLKELDHVIDLLLANVGVEFILTELARTFESATEEAMKLKKFLHLIIRKTVKNIDDHKKRKNVPSSTNSSADEDTDQEVDLSYHGDKGDVSGSADQNHMSPSSDASSAHSSNSISSHDDDDDSDGDDENNMNDSEIELDSNSQSTWTLMRSLISSLMLHLATNGNRCQPSLKAAVKLFASSTCSMSSSSTSTCPSPEIPAKVGVKGAQCKQSISSTLKDQLLVSLADHCRQCGHKLNYNSPVQPVGTDSLTILEACTLVRFLLGDSRPYHQTDWIDVHDENGAHASSSHDSASATSMSIDRSLWTNSVSVFMNRCSALEPSTVFSPNYTLLILFFNRIVDLMCRRAKSFTPVDLKASTELCLALCSKLKPAIMQTFVTNYREHVLAVKSKEFDQASSMGVSNQQQPWQHGRKPSLISLFNNGENFGQGTSKKSRSSPSISSNSSKTIGKQLEQVKEETEDEDLASNANASDQPQSSDIHLSNDDQHENDEQLENDDLKIELAVYGVLEFFSIFVEKIMVQNHVPRETLDRNVAGIEKKDHLSISDYYKHKIMDGDEAKTLSLNIRNPHELSPIYQLLCELIIEIGTIPLLSSPAFLLKRQDSKSMINTGIEQATLADQQAPTWAGGRWFVYLIALSVNGLASCSAKHQTSQQKNQRFSTDNANQDLAIRSVCCRTRQIAYTSLSTILDLMTITKAYIVSQPCLSSNLINTFRKINADDFQIPNYVDMTLLDLFPGTIVAKRLNFFPLVHPKMLQHVYESTFWFKQIAIGLWSNLSGRDSSLHHWTAALLQQLHSISNDPSICEVVICDEMLGVTKSMQKQWAQNFQLVYGARSKFSSLFAMLHDKPFISERLALMVSALCSAANPPNNDSSEQHHPFASTLLTDQESARNDSDRLIAQLELDVATCQLTDVMNRLTNNQSYLTINYHDLHRLLRITCPLSPVALSSTLKRHFDRPLFIMLDALSQRRTSSDQYSTSANWLLNCISNPNVFGIKHLMFSSPSPFGVTCEFQNLSNYHLGCNNIRRLMEPLLFILLHPNTSRLTMNNVNIIRNHGILLGRHDDQYANTNQVDPFSHQLSLQQANNITPGGEQSKIYAIKSTNGNVVYHIGRCSPSNSATAGFTDGSKRLDDYHQDMMDDVDVVVKQVIDEIVEHIYSDLQQDSDGPPYPTEQPSGSIDCHQQPTLSVMEQKSFPGTASLAKMDHQSVMSAGGTQTSADEERLVERDGQKLFFSKMHMHLLLYERRYDSLRTTYAMDTILSMIETWPSKVLYSMATSILFDANGVGSSSMFDGSRGAQIYSLFQRHRNCTDRQDSLGTFESEANRSRVALNKERHSHQDIWERDNLTMLELIIQICLLYLRSYYPSCPADARTDKTVRHSKDSGFLFNIRPDHCIDLEDIEGNQRVRLLACQALRIIFKNLSKMIEVSINHGRDARHSSHKRQPSEPLLSFSQSKSFAQFLKDLMNRCQVQRTILQCLVTSVWHFEQKNRPASSSNNLTVKSDQQASSSSNASRTQSTKHKSHRFYNAKTGSYLFPGSSKSKTPHPVDVAFIQEILDYNDYPQRDLYDTFACVDHTDGNTFRSSSPEESDAFHDEMEKSLLNLIEQVIILEFRINFTLHDGKICEPPPPSSSSSSTITTTAMTTTITITTTTTTSTSSSTTTTNTAPTSSSSRNLPRASVKDLSEMYFENELPLVGQPWLNGAFHYALQQKYRGHVHDQWLTLVECGLHYSGRFITRLVLTVINQLSRNLDSCCKEIDCFFKHVNGYGYGSHRNDQVLPLAYRNFFHILQGLSMIYCYCLLDRNQYESLAPILNKNINDDQDQWLRTFGLLFKKRVHNSDHDGSNFGSDQGLSNNMGSVSASGNGPTGAMQAISSMFHNLITVGSNNSVFNGQLGSVADAPFIDNTLHSGPISMVNSSNSSNISNSSSIASNSHNSNSQQDTLLNNLSVTRLRILDYTNLNRVVTSLFNAWCLVMVPKNDVGSHGQDILNSGRPNNNDVPYSEGWHRPPAIHCAGSSNSIRRSILTIFSILANDSCNGIALMKSIARVWHDLRDRNCLASNVTTTSSSSSINNFNTSDSSLLAETIDLVVAPSTVKQNELVRLISSLTPVLNLENLIQIVRQILKPSSATNLATISSSSSVGSGSTSCSSTNEVESTQLSFTSNPFDNIFLIEVSLLEFFLAYIRTCPGELLLKSWRSMLALIKDAFALNLTASVPYETFWPRNRCGSPQLIPSHSVQINFQPLINIHLLALMHEFVTSTPFVEDRRAQKELQEVAQKLIDANINVASGRLSPPRIWTFKRNFEVMPVNSSGDTTTSHSSHHHGAFRRSPVWQRPPRSSIGSVSSTNEPMAMTEETLANVHEQQHITVKRGIFRSSASVQFQDNLSNNGNHANDSLGSPDSTDNQSESLLFGLFNVNLANLLSPSSAQGSSGHQDLANTSQNLFFSYFCIKSLYAMAEYAASILDVVYTSEEKEKMIPLITTLMSYVIPYLKSHSQHNLPCFDACSRLLAALSGYQYTRKAWRRESFELLLDGSFFQMLPECLPAWRTIIDHLMTHDKNTFREFLQRMSVAQSPSVSLKMFVQSSNKDQESEPRAQLVKRLAFILFCSEKDQYQKYMAEIQEKLIEIHRTSQQQNISQPSQLQAQCLLQSQVLLAFRVILLRMSCLASLWPFIYTEMFQVFLTIEQQLIKVIREERKNELSLSWHTNTSTADCNYCPLDVDNSHRLSSGSSMVIGHHRTSKLDPKIPPAQLQLFLNACKLLDLALLLPSDTLPQFQLHKWAFISDPASTIQSLDLFNLFGTGQGPSLNDGQQQISKHPWQSENLSNLPTSSGVDSEQPSSLNLELVTGVHLENLKSHSETTSLNSAYDSIAGALHSLPVNLSTSQTSGAESNGSTTFIPHVVFINYLLNYLTDCLPTQVASSNTAVGPLLTMSSIQSIHELHPFFAALLHRSNQTSTYMPSFRQQTHQIVNNDHYRRSLEHSAVHYNSGPSSVTSLKGRRKTQSSTNAMSKARNSSPNQPSMPHQSFTAVSNGGCSLDELFINIDRIIANDFLEPLPSLHQTD